MRGALLDRDGVLLRPLPGTLPSLEANLAH